MCRNSWALLLTCEHATAELPAPFAALARKHRRFLASHRGFDAGALTMATQLAAQTHAPLIVGSVSRLLVDLNRPVGDADLYGPLARRLEPKAQARLAAQYHAPHWHRVHDAVATLMQSHPGVLHLACHSFTPILRGVVRPVDLGLLYDPKRPSEQQFCRHVGNALRRQWPGLRVVENAPYRGDAPGLTTTLRTLWPDARYLGIELEVNQRYVRRAKRSFERLCSITGLALAEELHCLSTARRS